MSTQINQYLIYGVKLDFKEHYDYDKFEPYTDSAFDDEMNPNGLHCLYDGMNGEYIYVGRCLKKSGNHKFLPNIEIRPIDPEVEQITKALIKALLGIEAPLQLHLVTHYR